MIHNASSALHGAGCWRSAHTLTRLKTEKAIPLITKAPADSPKVRASVATARGTSRKKAAVLKTKDAPRAAAPRTTANRGPAGAASCQADAQYVLRRAPRRRQLIC